MYEQTTTSLLEGLADPSNEQVWREFDERYRVLLIGLARRLGLSDADAHDAVQETLTRFYSAYSAGKYSRERGRLRSWITSIARNCIMDAHAANARRKDRRGMSAIEQRWDNAAFDTAWDAACRRAVLLRSIRQLRSDTGTDETTIHAFEEVVLRGRAPREVAEALGVTPNDVYLAKHRCLSRLRAIAGMITEAYENDEGGAA